MCVLLENDMVCMPYRSLCIRKNFHVYNPQSYTMICKLGHRVDGVGICMYVCMLVYGD